MKASRAHWPLLWQRSSALAGLSLALLAPLAAAAQTPEREWTAVLLMSAGYDDMQQKLSWTGSSADVNVVALHDQDGMGMIAYAMQPSPTTPGQCCPDDTQALCCGATPIPLTEMGINAGTQPYIYSAGVLDAFFAYVATHYPARHYLISVRGQMDGMRLLMHNAAGGGLTLPELVAVLSRLNAATGRRVDVLNLGMCLGGVVDWAFAARNVADYFVGSANFTNAPVSIRWRFYQWVRELIANPAMTGRELAQRIPELFAADSAWCLSQPHQCTNTNPPNPATHSGVDEPWTVAAVDLGAIDAVAEATQELVCALVGDFAAHEPTYATALSDASVYGLGYGSYTRADLGFFAQRLAALSADAAVDAAAAGVVAALGTAVLAARAQPGYFDGGARATGLSMFGSRTSGSLDAYQAHYGDYQIASMWRLLLQADVLGATQPAISSLAIEPAAIDVVEGTSVTVTARGVSAEYGRMCLLPVDWDPSGLVDVGELSALTNPTVFDALLPGSGSLAASLGGAQATVPVTVSALPPPVDPPVPPPADGDPAAPATNPGAMVGGCGAVAAPGGPIALFALLLGWRRRREGRR